MERELQEMKRKQQDAERNSRNIQTEQERYARDMARLEEQILRKDEEARKERDKEELDRMEAQRREVDDRKRKLEQEVQRKMDDLKRMQVDMDRQLADLKRLEEEALRKEQEKLQKQEQITFEQAQRQQAIEVQIEQKKLMAGTAGAPTLATGSSALPMPAFGGDSTNSNAALMALAQQIEALRQDILRLQMNNGGGSTRAVVSNGGSSLPRNRVAAAPAGSGQVQNAAVNTSWRGTDYGTVKTPEDGSRTYASAGYNTPVPAGNLRPHPSHADTHKNVSGPKMGKPSYKGGAEAMNSVIIQKLKDAGVCGVVSSMFEVTVNPQGNVVQQRILSVNDQNAKVYMAGILQGLKFEPTSNRFNQSMITNMQAEIKCESNDAGNSEESPMIEMPESSDQ